MSAHSLYEVEYEYDGSRYLEPNMFFQKAVDFAADCLRRSCWPVILRPIRRIRVEEN